MSQINGLNPTYNVQRTQQTAKPAEAAAASDVAKPARAADRLELSGAAGALASLKANDVRTDKVNDIRAQIEAGTYLTDEKLDAAADRMLDDVL
ncbi:MAG: flagellar biosynthesis anti-sigma factor FlgM [Phycisphaerae bacterium]